MVDPRAEMILQDLQEISQTILDRYKAALKDLALNNKLTNNGENID